MPARVQGGPEVSYYHFAKSHSSVGNLHYSSLNTLTTKLQQETLELWQMHSLLGDVVQKHQKNCSNTQTGDVAADICQVPVDT